MNAPLPASVFDAARDSSPGVDLDAHVRAEPVIVVGGGPVGIRVCQELARRGLDAIVFNAERWQPYNRVKLTPLLCGDVQLGQVSQSLSFARRRAHHALLRPQRHRHRPRRQDRHRQVRARLRLFEAGAVHGFARARSPIPGKELSGVFTFRNFDDVERLLARSFRSRRTVVIGGGLLGLEAARGMAARRVETWVVEHEGHLMARQLDPEGGEALARDITALGLVVRTGKSVKAIQGAERVEAIELSGGETIACDTVILCTGIRPNMELARDIGLAVGRGIKVSAEMLTSDPDIYAVGECAEFDGHVYGLVGPGFEQAHVAAAHIAGEPAGYRGSVPATKLKIVGTDVFSMGDVEQLEHRSDVGSLSFAARDGGIYRRLVLKRGRVVGGIAVGDWPEINRLQEAIRAQARLWPWQLARFALLGRLWSQRAPASVREWPRAATVCNCTGVTRGQIGDVIALGCASIDDVKRDTGASTVCGSCGPLIAELLGAPPERKPAAAFRPLAVLSVAAALLALLTFASPIWPTAKSILLRGPGDLLWLDGTWKQVSGFILLGLSALAAALFMRKRLGWVRLGQFASWRFVHVALGTLTLAVLFLHTGFRLGAHLNRG